MTCEQNLWTDDKCTYEYMLFFFSKNVYSVFTDDRLATLRLNSNNGVIHIIQICIIVYLINFVPSSTNQFNFVEYEFL